MIMDLCVLLYCVQIIRITEQKKRTNRTELNRNRRKQKWKKAQNKVFKKPKREWKKSKRKREKKRILPVFGSHFLVSFSIPRCVVFSSFISVSVFFVPFSVLLFSSARICGCMKKCLPWRRKKKHWMLVRCDLALRVHTVMFQFEVSFSCQSSSYATVNLHTSWK